MTRSTQTRLLPMLAVALMIAFGCAPSESGNRQASSDGAAPAPPAPPSPVQPAPPTPPSPPAVNDNTEAVAAEVGFGAKGHYDSNDYISVAVSTQFRVQEQISLLNITRAMQQYKALNEGYPKTGEVFFKEIIEANSIVLPELPAGQQFGYDPELANQTSAEQSLVILKPKKP